MGRLEFVQRELAGYREYVEDWKLAHDSRSPCWAVEDVIGKANYVFDGIVHLRTDLNSSVLGQQAGELYVRRFHLLRQWLDLSESVVSEFVPELEKEHGEVEGARSLRTNIETARAEIYSPQRIEIDADGNVYEQTGERGNCSRGWFRTSSAKHQGRECPANPFAEGHYPGAWRSLNTMSS